MNSTEIPVLIGVTGHRDLLEPEQVRKQLELFFDKLRLALPDTRFCLISGFAAGADQLFVSCGKKVLGERAETFAVFPFPREEYRKDFSERELADFRRLADAADYVEELPGSRENEAEAYGAVGKFLVEHANIMVSIWDGKVACDPKSKLPKKGGTWEVSDMWMNYEEKNPEHFFSTFRNPVLIRIPAQRLANSDRSDKEYHVKDFGIENDERLVIFDASSSAEQFLSRHFTERDMDYALEQINAYNALCKKDPPGRATSKKYLAVTNESGVEKDIERFAVLDDSANTTQKRYGKQFMWIFMLSFLLGICAQIFGGFDHEFLSFELFNIRFQPITWALPLYLILVVGVFVCWLRHKRSGIDNRYLDYRALAEVLRVAIFWKIAGVDEDVRDHFLRKSPEHAEWIVIALNNWSLLDRHAPDGMACVNDTDVRKAWVEDQLKYYGSTGRKLKNQAERIRLKAIAVAGISMLFGIYFFIDIFIVRITPPRIYDTLYAMNGILISFGSFFMASLNFFLEKKGWEESAESYLSKEKLFRIVSHCLDIVPPDKTKKYLAYLGETALQEHEEWLDQQRQRKPEPNIG